MVWAPDYVTLPELKSFLRIGDDVDNAELAVHITAASRAVDLHTSRQFGVVAAAEQRFYTGWWDRRRARWVVEHDDLMSTSGFVVQILDEDDAVVGPIDQFVREPRNAAQISRPWTHLVVKPKSTNKPTGAAHQVAITALWGWSTVPTAVKEACLLQASRFSSRRDSPYGIAGSPDQGSELRLLARVDADVGVSLGSYIRWWAAA